MSKRKSNTTLKYTQKNYSFPVKGVKSPLARIMKVRGDDSLENLIYKFKNGTKRNKDFIALWNRFENMENKTVGYFFGAWKIYSDNYKRLDTTLILKIGFYKEHTDQPDLFDYLENWLNLKRKKCRNKKVIEDKGYIQFCIPIYHFFSGIFYTYTTGNTFSKNVKFSIKPE